MSKRVADAPRIDQIRTFIEREQRASVHDIAAHFDVSAATARRAIGALSDRGEVVRFRGGACAVKQPPRELPAVQRQGDCREEKRRIGKLAADLIGDGETVFLGSGTTTLEVARNLVDRQNLTVLTNSHLIIKALIPAEQVTVIALGGMLRRSELSFIGHLVEQALQEMRVAKAIMGIRAIHPEQGLMNDYLPETLTDRAIVKTGGEVIVVADHTKCGRVAPAFVAPVSVMSTLVTDHAAPEGFIEALSAKGVTVMRA